MATTFPYVLQRAGVVMRPDPADPLEAEGVLNPASARADDGRLYLFPRVVATGNVSRIGRARVVVEGGVPVGVERDGITLAPDRSWEQGIGHGGVEDARITTIPALGVHVMTYVAFGPLGPRAAVVVSTDLTNWRRLGPVLFGYDDAHDVDLNLFHNKDTLFLPEPVTGPDGRPSLAVLHRPMWDVGQTAPGQGVRVPVGLPDDRESIWMSFVGLASVLDDVRALTLWSGHRFVAAPAFDWEVLKIGGGPPPVRVREGWLLVHHGVSGHLDADPFAPQKNVVYSAGGMILDADEPWRVVDRSSEPLLAPETTDERDGAVANVVFPTAIEEIEGTRFLFYGMADSAIGVARLVGC